MNATRRGFLGALLALPVVGKLAQKSGASWPLTIRPTKMASNVKVSRSALNVIDDDTFAAILRRNYRPKTEEMFTHHGPRFWSSK